MSGSGAVWVGAITALAGTGLGACVTLAVEPIRARNAASAARREALLKSCSDFTAAVARVRSQSHGLAKRPEEQTRVLASMEDARVECERLRLLIDASDTQRAARMVVRHLYAVWKLGLDGVDPRAERYPDDPPHARLRRELTILYVGVRRETGSSTPEDVFEDPLD
jgi:hypothetical protein